jgi:hypothetical protein
LDAGYQSLSTSDSLFTRGNSSAPEVHGLLDAVFLRQQITRKEKTTRSGFRLLDRLHAPLEARGMNQSHSLALFESANLRRDLVAVAELS